MSADDTTAASDEMIRLSYRMSRINRVLQKTFDTHFAQLPLALGFGVLRGVVAAFQVLDRLVSSRLRRTSVSRPIVLVGNPRTGTTFLQRFLTSHGVGCGMELVLMLYPSLLLQRLLRPVLPLLERLSPARFHSTAAHQTSLGSVETDDVAVLFRYLDGFFLYGFFLSFDDDELVDAFDPRVRDTSERDFAWLEELWRRSLVLHGHSRNVAKLFSLGPRLPQFLERFPDAQILYLARDPVAVIPSAMSLVSGVLDRAFGFWDKPQQVRDRWLQRMYGAWLMLLRRFHDDWQSGAIDRSRVFVVRYDVMMGNFETLMEDLCGFVGHEMTPELERAVRQQGAAQRSYTSTHRYDLERFGLSEATIRSDCAFYYDTFLPPLAHP